MGERTDELTGPYDEVVGSAAQFPAEGPNSDAIYDESGTITGDTYDTEGPTPVYMGDASDTYVGDVRTDTGGGDDLEATREQIEQTRSELSETIDAIQSKLSPSNVVQEAKDTVRDATVGRAQDMVSSAGDAAADMVSSAGDTAADMGGSIIDTIKRNPVPAALAGISLGWLIMNRPKSGPRYASRNGGYPRGYYPSENQYGAYRSNDLGYAGGPSGQRQATEGSDQGTLGRAAASAQGAVGDTVNQVQNAVGSTMNEVQSSVGSTMNQVQSSVGDAMNQVQSTAGDVVSNAGGTASDIGSTIVETIRQNPIPAALTGIGLGWLITRISGSGSQTRYDKGDSYYSRYSTEYPGSYRGYQSSNWDYQSQPSGGSTVDQARQTVGQAADQVQGTVSDAVSQAQGTVSDAVSQAQDAAGQVANRVQSQASQLGYQSQQAAQQATTGIQSMMQNNPLAVGAAAVAVGLALGLAVPETAKEDELMGEARADLANRAQQVVQDTAQKVQTVAQEAVGAAKQEAQEQNLM